LLKYAYTLKNLRKNFISPKGQFPYFPENGGGGDFFFFFGGGGQNRKIVSVSLDVFI